MMRIIRAHQLVRFCKKNVLSLLGHCFISWMKYTRATTFTTTCLQTMSSSISTRWIASLHRSMWLGMTTKSSEPMQSLYTFTDAETMAETLRRRWWVDPRVAYLHKHDADIEIIPKFSKTSEEYATAQIAQRINRRTMSDEYHKLQQECGSSVIFTNQDFANMFHTYMGRLCTEDRENAGGLSHIITRFSGTYNWPTPHEHYRATY